jgi:mRNA (guanine-N7-)-methyltransferase
MYDPARDSWEDRDGDDARSRQRRLSSDQPHTGFSSSEQIHSATLEINTTSDLVSIFLILLAVHALLV